MVKKRLVFEKGGLSIDGTQVSKSVSDSITQRLGMGPKGTRVIVKNLDTGEEIITHNKVLIAGAQWTAQMHWGLDEMVPFPTYNKMLELDEPLGADVVDTDNKKKISLFCCGTGGCGVEMSQIYDVDYTKCILPKNLIPFRYLAVDNDLSVTMRETYFGRKTLNADNVAYYFKKPSDPQMFIAYVDGTPIDENVYNSQNTTEGELYVQTVLMVTKEDFRDFFIGTTGINTAVMNQFSLCQAWSVTDKDGVKWYKDITPVTQVNISNESLIDLTKGIEITYQTYY